MPAAWPVWIDEYICAILPSRIRLRIAGVPIMISCAAIRNLIREGKIAQMYSSIQTGQAAGMQTLDQCLKELLQKGMITKEEARYRAQNKDDF